MVKRCVSVCKTFTKSECNPPRCGYINGNKRKYCRLSHKYIMNKPKCNITRKIKKKEVKNNAKTRIINAIKSSKMFLNIICPDTGMCIAFGNNADQLTRYFNGFTKFDYVISPTNRIGQPSANGFIRQIEYTKKGYKANAVLKSAKTGDSDNLLYEYLVGVKYVNRVVKLFPCFVETYGFYYYDTPISWDFFKNNIIVDPTELRHLTLQHDINYVNACIKSIFGSVLIQHINNALTLREMCAIPNFITNDLIYILFIIYHSLSSMSTSFTHYDLHTSNVLIYKPIDNHYMEYHYHYIDGTTNSFFSSYIPKMIDYGHSYFNNGNVNSLKIYEKICNTRECDPKCGDDFGFTWLDPVPHYGISSSQKNESHDLRLLNDLKFAPYIKLPPTNPLKKLFDKLIYAVGMPYSGKKYGTVENVTKTTFAASGTYTDIYNVIGAFNVLKHIINKPDVINENINNYPNQPLTKMGDLHIYENGTPMKYDKIV